MGGKQVPADRGHGPCQAEGFLWVAQAQAGTAGHGARQAGVARRQRRQLAEATECAASGWAAGWGASRTGVRRARGQGVGAGARRARQARDRVVTCSGPVHAQPKGLLRHAYEIGGSTEVLAPVALGHTGQAEARVGLHSLTDPGLRGQETRLSGARRPAGRQVLPRSGPHPGETRGTAASDLETLRQDVGDPPHPTPNHGGGASLEDCLEEACRHLTAADCGFTGHTFCTSSLPNGELGPGRLPEVGCVLDLPPWSPAGPVETPQTAHTLTRAQTPPGGAQRPQPEPCSPPPPACLVSETDVSLWAASVATIDPGGPTLGLRGPAEAVLPPGPGRPAGWRADCTQTTTPGRLPDPSSGGAAWPATQEASPRATGEEGALGTELGLSREPCGRGSPGGAHLEHGDVGRAVRPHFAAVHLHVL